MRACIIYYLPTINIYSYNHFTFIFIIKQNRFRTDDIENKIRTLRIITYVSNQCVYDIMKITVGTTLQICFRQGIFEIYFIVSTTKTVCDSCTVRFILD